MERESHKKRLKSTQTNESPDKRLLDSIIVSTLGKDFSDPQCLASLPFPFPGDVPERFDTLQTESIRYFQYMGRTGYTKFRKTVLGLTKYTIPDVDLPVREVRIPLRKAALWGTMGSGKSYMLAALACDLMASFNRSSRDSDGMASQRQRAVYLPDCEQLVGASVAWLVKYFRKALSLSYAEDAESLGRIAKLSDEASLTRFFEEESERGVFIYLLVDQVNALDCSKGEDKVLSKKKWDVKTLINGLAGDHFLVESASANNNNSKNWYRKQLNIAAVFHHGGLDDDEYKCWKEHFAFSEGSPTTWGALTEEEDLRVKDATGRVPLFLECWNDAGVPAETAWGRFITVREVTVAEAQLTLFMEDQLSNEVHRDTLLRMYLQFVTEGVVRAIPDTYDCRYLYVEWPSLIGRCVCGLYRDIIGKVLQNFRRTFLGNREWRQAIRREAFKPNPNFSLLGFMVEQDMIAQILEYGIPLYADTVLKCDKIVNFQPGSESSQQIEEGCILYVPSVFNYHRVDAIIRQYDRSGILHVGSPPSPQQLLKTYKKLQLHIAGVQITIGSLEKHLNSEEKFCTPESMQVWYPDWDSKDVGRWFIWYVLQSEIDKHVRDAVELSPCSFGNGEIKGKSRSGRVQNLDHVTIFRPLDEFEPSLKWITKTHRQGFR